MGVSLYVMPLGVYLGGEYKTVADLGAEIFGRPVHVVSPSGTVPPPRPLRLSSAEVGIALDRLRSDLRSSGIDYSPHEEGGPARIATSMSYGSFGAPVLRAARWAYRTPFPRLSNLGAPGLWIPATFDGIRQVSAPWDADAELAAVSSPGLAAELDRLLRLLEQEPQMEQLLELADGAILPGSLAEFHNEVNTAHRLLELARSSVEHRVPVIVEG